ncbi:MAG TPA: aspartate kinase [Chloroflexi bacterium]|nr:aspartate kinase [Chloroflexota bacterium]
MRTLTMKFGGTSVGDADAITQVTEIVRQARAETAEQVAVVVSAMSGVTDLLQSGVLCAAAGDATCHHEAARDLRERHEEAARRLLGDERDPFMEEINHLIEEYTRFCDSVRVLGEATPRALDYTMGLGERMSVRLVAAAMRQRGLEAQAVDATGVIVTDDRFQNAAPLLEETQASVDRVLVPMLERGIVPVVTGFIGATKEGISTTLGRGGSDYSAALLGVCLRSDEVWIWTDVDGVMSADPRIVPEARTIEVLSQREVSELAYFGAKVLHPKTIRPVLEAGIPLRVKNTFNPDHPGTLIVPNDQATDHPIKAVTAIRGLSMITVEGKGMMGVPGIAARTFGAVARTGTSVLIISQASSEQSICFVVPEDSTRAVVDALNEEFALEIARRDIDRVTALEGITIITVVGAGMRERPGIAGRIFTATGDHGVNVIAIAQGSSECSISLVVAAEDADEALRAIHPLTLEN